MCLLLKRAQTTTAYFNFKVPRNRAPLSLTLVWPSASVAGRLATRLLPRFRLARVSRPVTEEDDGTDNAHLDKREAAAWMSTAAESATSAGLSAALQLLLGPERLSVSAWVRGAARTEACKAGPRQSGQWAEAPARRHIRHAAPPAHVTQSKAVGPRNFATNTSSAVPPMDAGSSNPNERSVVTRVRLHTPHG